MDTKNTYDHYNRTHGSTARPSLRMLSDAERVGIEISRRSGFTFASEGRNPSKTI